MFEQMTTYYDLYAPGLSLRGPLLWASFAFVLVFLLLIPVMKMRKYPHLLERRGTDIMIYTVMIFFLSLPVAVLFLLGTFLWDRRFPEFPQARHDALAAKSPFLARVVYGASPQKLRTEYENRLRKDAERQEKHPKLARFMNSKKLQAEGERYFGFEGVRGVKVFAGLMALMGLMHVGMNAAVTYVAYDVKRAEAEVMEKRAAEPERTLSFLPYAEHVRMGEGEIRWFAPDDAMPRRLQAASGLGLGVLAFNVMHPDADLWHPAQGEWTLAHVYPEVVADTGVVNTSTFFSCNYVDGVLDRSLMTLFIARSLQVPDTPEMAPLFDLCPATFNPEGEPLEVADTSTIYTANGHIVAKKEDAPVGEPQS